MTAPRYYVSVNDQGERQLTMLSSTKAEAVSYPLPVFPPGLTEQLNEWRRWRDVLTRGLKISADGAPEQAAAFADTLGQALLASGDQVQP